VPSSCARGQRSLLSSAFGGEGGGAEEKGHAALVRKEFAKQAQRNYDNQAICASPRNFEDEQD
jgi:hypothetical protein